MSQYKTWYNGKVFVFEGEGVKVQDANVHALMQKIKRLKIGVDDTQNVKRKKQPRASASRHTA